MTQSCDIAIVGSGFSGSLLAMVLRRLGRSVVLLERGSHPRFAIGESSTPLANLLLEEIARRYDLPRLLPLCKWGTWQRDYPQVAVGLKRGFSFYRHTFGASFMPANDRVNELLVGASPHDAIGDTHWYRPDFDHFLVCEAQTLGAIYHDRVELTGADFSRHGVRLTGRRNGAPIEVDAEFVVDATGPRGFLHRVLRLSEHSFRAYPATEALYAHFRNVRRMDESDEWRRTNEIPPFPPDEAAVHHVFDGGWVWVLRFNNGITCAGVACTATVARRFRLADGAAAWERLLAELPSVAPLFADAQPVTHFTHAPRLSFRSGAAAGDRWALLPSAAGFVDPLLSTGFPLTLLGIIRLAEVLEKTWRRPDEMHDRLHHYADQTLAEVDAAARLVAALYASMSDFPLFARLTLLYFAAASFSEVARRLGRTRPPLSFLLHDHPTFGPAVRACCDDVLSGGTSDPAVRNRVMQRVTQAIEPFDIAGLSAESRRNWFPVLADDLRGAAGKLSARPAEIDRLLARCGFTPIAS